MINSRRALIPQSHSEFPRHAFPIGSNLLRTITSFKLPQSEVLTVQYRKVLEMYKVVVTALPVRCLSEEELRMAPAVISGDAMLIERRFPKHEFPTLVGGAIVESPNRENLHYISLLIWDPTLNDWKPALEDPRSG